MFDHDDYTYLLLILVLFGFPLQCGCVIGKRYYQGRRANEKPICVGFNQLGAMIYCGINLLTISFDLYNNF